jgi:hypothetical protein
LTPSRRGAERFNPITGEKYGCHGIYSAQAEPLSLNFPIPYGTHFDYLGKEMDTTCNNVYYAAHITEIE